MCRGLLEESYPDQSQNAQAGRWTNHHVSCSMRGKCAIAERVQVFMSLVNNIKQRRACASYYCILLFIRI